MRGNNKLITAVVILVPILAIGFYLWKQEAVLPKEHQAVKVFIKQLSENNLSLEEIKISKTYPAKPFKNEQLRDYYQAKIVDKKGHSLYLTQIPKEYLISRFTYPQYQTVGLITKPNNDIDLYLPVYQSADKLIIEDEVGNTLMTINLQNLSE